MLLDGEIRDIILVIDSAKDCEIHLTSIYPGVKDMVISKFHTGTLYVVVDGSGSPILRIALEAYIRAHGNDYHDYKVVRNEAMYTTLPSGACQHEYVNAGFRFIKEVCKHCDKER